MSTAYIVRPPRGDWKAGLRVAAALAGNAEEVGSVKVRSVDQSTAEISALYVSAAHRRRGVSRKLMQAVLEAARDAGVQVLRLTARSESPEIGLEALLAFYRALGFRQTGKSLAGNPVLEMRLTGVLQQATSRPAAVQLRRVLQRMDDGEGWKRDRDKRARQAQEAAKEINVQRNMRTVGGHTITIGIPYRDDGMGKAVVEDMKAVARGTNCRVIVISPGTPLRTLHLDAIFLPGGPFDQPNTVRVEGSRDRLPPSNKPMLEPERIDRHTREVELIREATAANIPILGVCGGSRRLATAHGATQVHLKKHQNPVHTGDMRQVQTEYKHNVVIEPGTLLNRLVATGNYRRWKNTDLPPRPIVIPVNSVHWASSHFPPQTPMTLTAWGLNSERKSDGVLEGCENPRQHFQVGVQWHPEYAQDGMGDFAPTNSRSPALPHQRIMGALGDAAEDGYAARVIQSGIRRYLAQKQLHQQRTGQTSSTSQGGPPSPRSGPPSGGSRTTRPCGWRTSLSPQTAFRPWSPDCFSAMRDA